MPSGSSQPRRATPVPRSLLRGPKPSRPRSSPGSFRGAVIRCYRIPFSTNVERVALAAGHKEVPIEWIDVDPTDRSPVEALSGQPLVPVLVAEDVVVSDSPRI